MSDLQRAKSILGRENLTCVVVGGEFVYKSELRGVAPLLKLAGDNTDVRGMSAADRVVGKGGALLFARLGVKEVHTRLLSKEGAAVFEMQGIVCTYDELTDRILNRAGDGYCPVESAVMEINDPAQAYEVIKKTVEKLMETSV